MSPSYLSRLKAKYKRGNENSVSAGSRAQDQDENHGRTTASWLRLLGKSPNKGPDNSLSKDPGKSPSEAEADGVEVVVLQETQASDNERESGSEEEIQGEQDSAADDSAADDSAVESARQVANFTSQLLSQLHQDLNSCSIHERCNGSCFDGAVDVVFRPTLISGWHPITIEMNRTLPPTRNEPLKIPDTAGSHVYTALNRPSKDFRLIAVKRGVCREDYLDCELIHFALDTAPEFAALSYCWGSGKPDIKMMCNGKIFMARASLECALKRYRAIERGDDSPLLLWADAICIDQENASEKDKQLFLMNDIYRKAKTVYIDLGDVDAAAWYPGYDLMNRIHSVLKESEAAATLPAMDHPSGCWDAYFGIFRVPWFTRRWIIQEICLARDATIMYGRFSFDWERWEKSFHFLYGVAEGRILQFFADQDVLLGHGMLNFAKIRDIKNNHFLHHAIRGNADFANGIRRMGADQLQLHLFMGQHTTIKLVQLVRDFECSEPRDRLFSLMALMDNETRSALGSYQLSVGEIYTRFARYHCEIGQVFTMLDHAGLGHRSLLEPIPSWVPDWTAQYIGGRVVKPISTLRKTPYSASGTKFQNTQTAKINAIPTSITLKGFIVGSVTGLRQKQHFTTGKTYRASLLQWHAEIKILLGGSKDLHNSVYPDIDDALARLLLMDDLYTGGNAITLSTPITDPVSTCREAFQKLALDHSPSFEQSNGIGALETHTAVGTYLMQMQETAKDRVFATTDKGHIALIGDAAAVGDVLVVFAGATVPYVLRSRPEGSCYDLIGDGFVQGIMYGEAMPAESDLIDITIC